MKKLIAFTAIIFTLYSCNTSDLVGNHFHLPLVSHQEPVACISPTRLLVPEDHFGQSLPYDRRDIRNRSETLVSPNGYHRGGLRHWAYRS